MNRNRRSDRERNSKYREGERFVTDQANLPIGGTLSTHDIVTLRHSACHRPRPRTCDARRIHRIAHPDSDTRPAAWTTRQDQQEVRSRAQRTVTAYSATISVALKPQALRLPAAQPQPLGFQQAFAVERRAGEVNLAEEYQTTRWERSIYTLDATTTQFDFPD